MYARVCGSAETVFRGSVTVKMSMLTANKKTNIDDNSPLMSAVTGPKPMNQTRPDAEYDEEDDLVTSRSTATGSPPPVSGTIGNSAGTKPCLLHNK